VRYENRAKEHIQQRMGKVFKGFSRELMDMAGVFEYFCSSYLGKK